MVKMPEIDFSGLPMMPMCSSRRAKTKGKGLVECDVLHRLWDLNSWFPVSSPVWGGLGGMILMEEGLGGRGFKASKPK